MFKKTIISEFFTTVSFSQMMQSLYMIFFKPFSLKSWKDKQLFEKEFLEKINPSPQPSPLGERVNPKIISFYNWRSAIFHALKMIWVTSEDEVIVNAYNCVSVSNAVIQSWAKIVYSDIEKETLALDFDILKKNITPKTKVIIIQHTFWKLARDYEKIIDFAKQNNIIIIEDCAHSLGNNLGHPQGEPLQEKNVGVSFMGTLKWDFLVFSTGRDKVISSVTWGFLVINNKEYFNKINDIKEKLEMPTINLIERNLMYNFFWYLAYKFYDFFKFWRIIIFLSRKLKLITEILTPSEKACNFDNFYLDYPNSLAYLARKELKKIDEYTKIRLENARYYLEKIKNSKIKIIGQIHRSAPTKNDVGVNLCVHPNNWFRFPILLESEEEKNRLVKLWRKNKIIFWTSWSWINLAPIWTNLEKSHYKIWSCPVAENISKRILILPNHKFITKKDMDRVIEVLNNF